MRTATLIGFLFLSAAAIAQSWCPPEAVWVYRYDGWGVDYREEYRYVGDTLYEGRPAQRVTVTVQGSGVGGTPISGYWTEYTAHEGDLVSLWSAQWNGIDPPAWDTLYWFGAQVGDRWWPPGHPRTCPPHGMLEVVAVGESTIGGITLQQLTVVTIDEDGQSITNPMQITERVGMTPRNPHLFPCGGAIDYFFPHFICYSDQDFQVPSGGECQLTVGSLEPATQWSVITIFPNPGTTSFQLTGLGQRPAILRLLDLQGRVLLEETNVMDQQPLDASALPPGAYLVEVSKEQGRQVLRWVKE